MWFIQCVGCLATVVFMLPQNSAWAYPVSNFLSFVGHTCWGKLGSQLTSHSHNHPWGPPVEGRINSMVTFWWVICCKFDFTSFLSLSSFAIARLACFCLLILSRIPTLLCWYMTRINSNNAFWVRDLHIWLEAFVIYRLLHYDTVHRLVDAQGRLRLNPITSNLDCKFLVGCSSCSLKTYVWVL